MTAPITMRTSLFVGISALWIPLAFLFDGVTVLVLPIRLSGGATDIGLVSFAGLALGAAIQPIAGWLSDRSRQRVDRRAIAVGAVPPAIIGLWLLVGSSAAFSAVVGYALVQAAAATIQAAQQTLIPEHVRPDMLGRAAGFKAAFDVGGAFGAFLVLGLVLQSGNVAGAAIVTTAALVVGALALMALVPGKGPSTLARDRSPHAAPAIAPLVAARFLFLFGTYVVGRFLVLLVAQRLGIDPQRAAAEAGGLLASFTLATAAAALAFGWLVDRTARQRELMAAGAVIAAIGIASLVPANGVIGVIVGGLLMSIGTGAFITANWAATTAIVPAAVSGRLMGVANLGTALAAAAAGLVGPLIDAGGFAPALLVAALASIAALIPIIRVQVRTPNPAESLT